MHGLRIDFEEDSITDGDTLLASIKSVFQSLLSLFGLERRWRIGHVSSCPDEDRSVDFELELVLAHQTNEADCVDARTNDFHQ